METAQPLQAACPTDRLSLWGKRYFLHPVWTPLVSVYAHCPYPSHHAQLWRDWLHLLNNLHANTGGCC